MHLYLWIRNYPREKDASTTIFSSANCQCPVSEIAWSLLSTSLAALTATQQLQNCVKR